MGRELQRAIEQAIVAAGLDQVCPGCGWLSRMSSCSIVVRGDDPVPACTVCGGFLDGNGNAAGHRGEDGVVRCRVIRLPGAS